MQHEDWKYERSCFLTPEQWQQLDEEVSTIERGYNHPSRWGRCRNFLLYLYHRISWLFMILLTLGGARTYAQSGIVTEDQVWAPVREEGGISVFRRSQPDRPTDEVRVLATLPVSRDRVMALLGQVNRYVEWVYKCDEATLVKRLSEDEMVYYTSIDLPWPVVDRDIVIHSKSWIDPGTGDILSESAATNGNYPKVADHVRMVDFHSYWRISTSGPDETTIDYRVSSDIGGSIPSWLINLGITTGPLHSMQQLEALLTEGS